MAITSTKEPMVRDFWPWFEKVFTWAIILSQLFMTLMIAGALMVADVFDITDVSFLLTIVAVGFGSLTINLIVFSLVTEPFKNLLNAIVHAAGEPTSTPLPNPNSNAYAKVGFKKVLQTVYELGSSRDEKAEKPELDSPKQKMLERALSSTTTGFVVLNHKGKVLYSNKAAPVRTNQSGHEELQLYFNNEQSLDDWIAQCEENEVHAQKIWRRVYNKLPGEDDRRIFDLIASYQKGSSAEVVLSFIDYTDQYLPEEDELDFIAFAAHELRGPITVIRGYLDVLDDELATAMQPDQKELLKRLTVSASRLSSYINNILNASRYDRRHLKVHLSEDTASDIYATIKDDMELRAVAQGRLLNVAIPSNLPSVAADRASIGEVLGNLIDNGIKYSHEGGTVFVTAETRGDFVEISIRDEGIGMPSSVVSNLFHKFYRSHRSRETVAGTGIGLYICRAFVESNGGTISVRSAEGEGSTFTFSLPIWSTVKDKLDSVSANNESLIRKKEGWIKNHSMYRG